MNIDAIIFIIFLIITLFVGINYGSRLKSLKSYALGDKDFSTITISATISATYISGSMLHITISNVYSKGISYLIGSIGIALGMLWIGDSVGKRMAKFVGDMSVAESLGRRYGKAVRLISAISSIMVCIGMASVQFKVSSFVLERLFGLDSMYATMASAVIVIIYSSLGGIRSVAFTDVLQFFTFCVLLPILCFIIWKKVGDIDLVYKTIKTNKLFSLLELLKNKKSLQYGISLAIYGFLGGLRPSSYQRLLISKNKRQIKIAYRISTIIFIFLKLILATTAIVILTQNPDLKTPDSILSHIINTYLGSILKGLMSACIMAMVMSTADSSLNSGSVIFINDFLPEIGIKVKNNIIYIRLISIMIGLFALLIAFTNNDLLKIVLLANSFYMPIVIVPLILVIFNYNISKPAILSGMVSGFITVILWSNVDFFSKTNVNSVIPGMLANIVTIFIAHYIRFKKSIFDSVTNK